MSEVVVTRKDMIDIANYMENGGLVDHMNNAGLSFGAMALILTAIEKECIMIKSELYMNGDIDILKEEENVR